MVEQKISLKLSMPISVNKSYDNAKKWRTKSDAYKNWEYKATIEMLWQTVYTITWNNWLEVSYKFMFPIYNKDLTIKKKDVFNYEKVLSDFLEHNITWFSDKKILKWYVEKVNSDLDIVEITIKEIKM